MQQDTYKNNEQIQTHLKEKYLTNLPEKTELTDNCVAKYIKDEFEYMDLHTLEEILSFAQKWTPDQNKKEQELDYPPRPEGRCHSSGGWQNHNQPLIKALKSVGKEILAIVGKKILQGQLNLTTISFPIRAMVPQTALEKALQSACLFPLYINRAAQIDDKVERMKLTITACIANFHYNQGYGKPLNPIIGETCEGSFEDGTKLYAEQISHHPPVTYLLIESQDKSYQFYGNYNYSSKAGLNSLTLSNVGKRNIKFAKDGQVISYNFAKEVYSGVFMGAMKCETKGELEFVDKENDIKAVIYFEKKFQEQNYGDEFIGEITHKGEIVSKISGSYLSHTDFDDQRYFDYRYTRPYKLQIQKNSVLESGSEYRLDKLWVLTGDIENAQKYKEQLEQIQRTDAKLRKEYKLQQEQLQQEQLQQEQEQEEEEDIQI